MFSCAVYVVGTYNYDSSTLFINIEIGIAALFAVDYIWGFSISKDKREFMLNPMNIIDLITILPVVINLLSVRNK